MSPFRGHENYSGYETSVSYPNNFLTRTLQVRVLNNTLKPKLGVSILNNFLTRTPDMKLAFHIQTIFHVARVYRMRN